jgi:hypothetical protein
MLCEHAVFPCDVSISGKFVDHMESLYQPVPPRSLTISLNMATRRYLFPQKKTHIPTKPKEPALSQINCDTLLL